jgi:nucleoside-diphosphate-sugar epimerase
MRALVTGASGFVGRQTLAPLLALGFEVHSIGRNPVSHPGVIHHEASLFSGRLTNDIVRAVKPTHVLHLAWYVEHGRFWTSPQNLDWVAASLDFAQMCVEEGATRFVGTGTCIEYDWSDAGVMPRREEHPLAPTFLYGEAKAACFRLLRRFMADEGISFGWGRLFHLFGPGEGAARFVPSIVRPLRAGEPVEVKSGGLIRDYLSTVDAGAALAALLASDVEDAVNIASGEAVRLAQIAGEIARQLGRVNLLKVDPAFVPEGEIPMMAADVTRLTQEVGFRPGRRRDRLTEIIKARVSA